MITSKLLILAGGFGTRLRSMVADRPKPLAQVSGFPFLEYLIRVWVEAGQREFVFLLHHQAWQVIEYLEGIESSLLSGCQYKTVIEKTPMGTGGAIANAVHEIGLERGFLIANADTWLGNSLLALNDSVSPSMAIVKVPDAARYGSVRFDEGDMVTGFVEKQGARGPGWINAGMYHLHAGLFSEWDGRAFSLEEKLFPHLAKKLQLRAVRLKTEFIDIGIPKDYQRFNRWVETGRIKHL